MSEIIPAYNPTHAASSSPQNSKGVDLAPITIFPSLLFWRLQLIIYSLMFLSATVALVPFMLDKFYWLPLWLIFLMVMAVASRDAWRIKNADSICLSVTQKVWRISKSNNEFIVTPDGDILLWQHVIVLHLRDTVSKRKYRITVFTDSVTLDEWRRLRVFLRMGLRKNI